MHRGDFDPVGVRFERPFDLGRIDADVIVVVGAPERMHAVGAQRNGDRRLRRGMPQGALHGDETCVYRSIVADLDVVPRQTGVGAHRAPILVGGFPVVDHGMDDKPRQLAGFLLLEFLDALLVVGGDFDRRAAHDFQRGLFNFLDRDSHGGMRLSSGGCLPRLR
ncbi:hypothetical protein D9M68_838370 [compost metagenome]